MEVVEQCRAWEGWCPDTPGMGAYQERGGINGPHRPLSHSPGPELRTGESQCPQAPKEKTKQKNNSKAAN